MKPHLRICLLFFLFFTVNLGLCQTIKITNILNKTDLSKDYITPGDTLKIVVESPLTKSVDLYVDNNLLHSLSNIGGTELEFKIDNQITSGVWSKFGSKDKEKTFPIQLKYSDGTAPSSMHSMTFVKSPVIKSIYSIIRNNTEIAFNDEFIIEMNHMNFTPSLSPSNLPILYINNKPFEAIEGIANTDKNLIFFRLNVPNVENKDNPWVVFMDEMDNATGEGVLNVGIGLKDGNSSKNTVLTTFRFFWINKTTGKVVLIVIFFVTFYLGFKGNFLRNDPDGTGNTPAFSYSKVQLYYWTLIILLSFFYISIQKESLIELSNSNLALISIAPITALLSKGLGSTSGAAFKPAQKGKFYSVIRDILSDNNGIQLSRVQGLIFNLTFGCIFLTTVCSDLTMFDFGTDQLALLGISASVYSAFKPFEK